MNPDYLDQIHDELIRLGVTPAQIGERGLHASMQGDTVTTYGDDQAWEVPALIALTRLREVPDAGDQSDRRAAIWKVLQRGESWVGVRRRKEVGV